MLNFSSFYIWAFSLLLGCLYSSQSSIICFLVSIVPHQWHVNSSSVISFLMNSVSLLPSHPILSLKMYLISSIMYLFSLMYSYVLMAYLFPPSSQKSFSVGNSLLIIVLYLAFLIISWFRAFLTSWFHFLRSFSHC